MNAYCEKAAGTLGMSKNEWLKCRKQGIGGSDIASIMGLNPYSSAFEVYINKTTDYENDLSDNEAVYWGTVLEDTVAREFERRTGKRVRRCNAVLRSKEKSFAIANVDRMICGERAGLECKTSNVFKHGEWENGEIPVAYICQCQWYMYVTGYEKWYIACLIGGQRFEQRCILRDEELIGHMLDKAEDFWENNVLKGEAPPMDGSVSCGEYIKKELSESEEKTVYLTSFVETLVKDIIEKKKLAEEIEKQIEKCENQVKQYMKEAAYGKGTAYEVIWNTQERRSISRAELEKNYPDVDMQKITKVSKYRKFKVKEIM